MVNGKPAGDDLVEDAGTEPMLRNLYPNGLTVKEFDATTVKPPARMTSSSAITVGYDLNS